MPVWTRTPADSVFTTMGLMQSCPTVDEDEEDSKKKKIVDKKKPQVTVIKKTHSDF